MSRKRFDLRLGGLRRAAVSFGIVLLAIVLGNGTMRTPRQDLIVADRGHTAAEFTPVLAPIAGTVVSVGVVDRQYVTAGTVLVALNAARYRSALARAEAKRTTAHAQVRASLTALAAQERTASDQVRAAVRALRPGPPPTARPRGQRTASSIPAGFTEAERQAAAADARVQQIAEAQVAAAQRIVDRDGPLQAEGLISAREVASDEQAYRAALAQAAAAAAALRDARAAATPSSNGTPRAVTGPASTEAAAHAALGTAQAALGIAATDRAAAEQKLERDKALLADGAIPANQVDADTTAYDAASARVDAANAAVRAARVQVTFARTAPPPASVPTTVTNAPRTAEDRLTQQAEATIAEAQRDAEALAAAQINALAAEQALDKAKVALSETVIRAPVDGWVMHSTTAPGETVRPGQTLMALSIRGRTWVAADVPQATGAKIRIGNAALVTVDGYRGHVWLGRVLRIESAPGGLVGPPRRGRAVEVQIALDPAGGRGQLPGGLSADVAIDTRGVSSVETPTRPEPDPTSPEASRPTETVQGAPHDLQLAQITDRERRVLAQLNSESEQIHAIVVGAEPGRHGGMTPSFLNSGLAWPVPGEVSSGYGWRIHPIFHTPEFHTGVDIAASWGAPVEAAADGTVVFTGRMPANGTLVILNHGNGLSTTYSHLSSFEVRVGDRVRRGQAIGRVGSTGWSTGPHLFFEVRKDGQPLDPLEP